MTNVRTIIIASTGFLIIVVAFLSLSFGQKSVDNDQMREGDSDSILSTAQIAFQCVNEMDEFNICVVNSDGTGFDQLTEVINGAGNFSPTINDASMIIYSCRDNFDHNLCVIKSDGSDAVHLTNDTREFRESASADINNQGIAVYKCTDNVNLVSEICMIDTSTLETDQLTFGDEFSSRPIINDAGNIVYICSEEGIFNLCTLDAGTKEVRQLTFVGIIPGHQVAAFASMNNAGEIAFSCTDEAGNLNICSIQFEGASATRLTNSENPTRNGEPSINDNGLIAYFCIDDLSNIGICVINSDGSDMRKLISFDEFTGPSWLRMNDEGLIVFNCPEETSLRSTRLCLINSDGTDFRELIAPPEGHRYFNASINN